ncbi:MAG: acetylornithine transaminase [Actinomycetales bacterium]
MTSHSGTPAEPESSVAEENLPDSLAAGLSTQGAGAELLDRYEHVVMNTFGTPQRALRRGEGCYVWDADDNRYLDLLAGIAVNSLGHAHPSLVGAVTAQLSTLGHVSNFFTSGPQVGLAERLIALLGAPEPARVFFANTGTEAVEAAFKIARRTGRPRVIAAEGAFHGRTMGALALTSKPAYREPFEPLPGGVSHVPFGDVDALAAAVDESVAAVVLEPIQGEAGVLLAPPAYLAAAREITTAAGALLIVDEVQTGMGRVGAWFAHQSPPVGDPGIVPDVITLAKGLGGGIPIGAVIAVGRAGELLGPGSHGTTFGGNPVACAAALTVLHVIERDGLLDHVSALGERWRADLAAADPGVAAVRGLGLHIGVDLREPIAAGVAREALAAGFIVNAPGPATLRLAPPLILTDAQADSFTAALPDLIRRAREAEEQASVPSSPASTTGPDDAEKGS